MGRETHPGIEPFGKYVENRLVIPDRPNLEVAWMGVDIHEGGPSQA